MLLAAAIERLYDLHIGTTPVEEGTPHEKPHKPLLLLAAFDLLDEGLATPERIPWCQELRARFTARFLLVRKHNDQNNPDLPFRQLMRDALIARYFPQLRSCDLTVASSIPSLSFVAEEEPEYGRSPAFRRKILAIYDHQCAACGLRIKLPAGNDVSFIDAAHLIPFSISQNDHPTNGLALCKNHHWAMDRNLIAPAPDHHWHVSKILDHRRSNGEKELIDLSGKSLLLPQDQAFHPDVAGLKWRYEQLIA